MVAWVLIYMRRGNASHIPQNPRRTRRRGRRGAEIFAQVFNSRIHKYISYHIQLNFHRMYVLLSDLETLLENLPEFYFSTDGGKTWNAAANEELYKLLEIGRAHV